MHKSLLVKRVLSGFGFVFPRTCHGRVLSSCLGVQNTTKSSIMTQNQPHKSPDGPLTSKRVADTNTDSKSKSTFDETEN